MGGALAGAPGAVAAQAAVAPLVLCRHPAAQALTPRGLRIESMARRQRRHLGVIAGLDRRVLQAAVARNSKFIDDTGQSALFFGCRKGSADPEDSRRQRRRSEEHTSELQSLMR